MTRIIAGRAGGRRLSTPKGTATRPSSDRVREALFSVVDSMLGSLEGLRFLDLYAGSGAVGLEAWSRGAGVVAFVEKDRKTAALIEQNAHDIGFARPQILTFPVEATLSRSPNTPYDVVFLDPPYPLTEPELAANLAALQDVAWLARGALVVVERSSRSPEPVWPAAWPPAESRKYGETVLWFVTAP